mmetsp:Transcript_165858/g.532534  ORF Transcript_165858/g.532534 Transcript_165858/m.532534 type:complete len:218 (+) Transcript_165858:101-754(+)
MSSSAGAPGRRARSRPAPRLAPCAGTATLAALAALAVAAAASTLVGLCGSLRAAAWQEVAFVGARGLGADAGSPSSGGQQARLRLRHGPAEPRHRGAVAMHVSKQQKEELAKKQMDERMQGIADAKAARDDVIEMQGHVTARSAGLWKVKLSNGLEVMATISGKMRTKSIKVIEGDAVTVELSPFDLTKGRITFRTIDKSAMPPPPPKRYTDEKKKR